MTLHSETDAIKRLTAPNGIKPVKEYEGKYKTVNDYADALRAWMNHVNQMQYVVASFPYFIANLQSQANTSSTKNAVPPASSRTETTTPARVSQTPAQNTATANTTTGTPRRGTNYFLPPIWKRAIAEGIDFILLFVIKLAVTYVIVDAFDLLEDVDKYDLESFGADLLADYKMALNMTSEILFLELIHRIGTCIFEALCLHRGRNGFGGATPGKRVMGLRVVRCEWVVFTPGEVQVTVYPSTDLGLGRAVIRSVVKNFSLTFLFPVCFTLFSFQYRRTIYDILAGSIVIDENAPRVRNNNTVPPVQPAAPNPAPAPRQQASATEASNASNESTNNADSSSSSSSNNATGSSAEAVPDEIADTVSNGTTQATCNSEVSDVEPAVINEGDINNADNNNGNNNNEDGNNVDAFDGNNVNGLNNNENIAYNNNNFNNVNQNVMP